LPSLPLTLTRVHPCCCAAGEIGYHANELELFVCSFALTTIRPAEEVIYSSNLTSTVAVRSLARWLAYLYTVHNSCALFCANTFECDNTTVVQALPVQVAVRALKKLENPVTGHRARKTWSMAY
ncbi:unnamed protein product, partial [Tuber aestivum]